MFQRLAFMPPERSIPSCPGSAGIRGVGMIEILITVLVLSIGLLSIAALQGFSLQSNQAAQHRTIATNIAYEVLDHMRVNRRHVIEDGALPGQEHWEERIQQQLPIPDDEDGNWGLSWTQDSARPDVVTVNIRWADDRSDEENPDWTISITTGI